MKSNQPPQSATLSMGQVKMALPKLKRRLEEVRNFSPEQAAEGEDTGKELITKLHSTMDEIFGHGSVEWNRYYINSFYGDGVISMQYAPHLDEKK